MFICSDHQVVYTTAFLQRRRRPGFTLVELLVVVAILAVLLALLMPLLGIVDRSAQVSATRVVLAKVDAAARQFRAEIGSYPYQPSYADLAAAGAAPNWSNRLAYQLGTDIAAGDLLQVRQDAAAAAAKYAFDRSTLGATAFAFAPHDVSPWNERGKAALLNRLAAERARLAVFAGNAAVTGPVMQPADWRPGHPWVRRLLPSGPLLTSPSSGPRPGWAHDYLAGALERQYRDGEAVLDAWGVPLLYVCQVVEGMTTASVANLLGYEVKSLRALEFGLQPRGRTTLGGKDAYSEQAVTAHATQLPDLANLRHSDRRSHAARGYEVEFELWSAGPDRRADWMRDHPANRDNLAAAAYDRTIP